MSILLNLSGTLELMFGRESGLQKIDLSADGFWRSFIGLGLAGGIDATTLFIVHSISPDQTYFPYPPTALAMFLYVGIYFISYLASLLALYFLCTSDELRQRFPTAVIVGNWAASIFSFALLLPLTILSQDSFQNDSSVISFAVVCFFGLILAISLRLYKITLAINTSRAIVFLVATGVVMGILQNWLGGMAGW
ncbi:MAG: hypothetical protein COC23_01660 [Hyphomicrobiales bacterium]|nr:MAG: hypothetical protein COC23_01660 [Hyphomicrobiales bacterium]